KQFGSGSYLRTSGTPKHMPQSFTQTIKVASHWDATLSRTHAPNTLTSGIISFENASNPKKSTYSIVPPRICSPTSSQNRFPGKLSKSSGLDLELLRV
ncbi:hypothetical protein DXG01_000904, partial [Tephrocybe rancida]